MNKATIDTDRSPLRLELVVLIVASLAATASRYVALPSWVFGRDRCAVSDRADRTCPHLVVR